MIKCITRPADDLKAVQLQGFHVPPKEPLQPGPRGVAIQVSIPSAQTGYQYCCVETAVAPKTLGPPPHFHQALDEISLVWEGALSVLVGDTVYEVPEGGMQVRPRGLIHTFWNATDKPVRFLDMFLNQNFDEYLVEFFRLVAEAEAEQKQRAIDAPATARRSPDPDTARRMADLDREFGITMFHERRQAILDKYGLER